MTQNKSYLIKCIYESLLDSYKRNMLKDEQLTYFLNAFPVWVRSDNWPSFGYRVAVRVNQNLTGSDPKGTIILIATFSAAGIVVLFDKLK